MAYDYYTNVYQGMATTPVSLYSEAAQGGAQVGTLIPTKTTASIRGAIQGLQEGQQIVSNQEKIQQQTLQNEILQNQVDRLPEINRAEDLRIEAQTIQNQQQQLKLQEQQLLQEDKNKTDQATLQVKQQQLNTLSGLITKKNNFMDAFSKADPLTQKQMVLDGANVDIFEAYPNLYSQSLSTVASVMSPQEIESASYALKRSAISKDQKARAEKAARLLEADKNAIDADYWLKEAAVNSGLDVENVISKAMPVPAGTYKTNPDGTIQIGPDGKLAKEEGVDLKSGRYDLVYGNKVITSNIPKETRKLMIDYQTHLWDMDGTALKRRMDALGPPPGQELGKTTLAPDQAVKAETSIKYAPDLPEEISGQSELDRTTTKPNPNTVFVEDAKRIQTKTPSGKINLAYNNEEAYTVVQKTLGLNTKRYSEIKPEVKKIFQAVQQPKGFLWGYSMEQQRDIRDSTDKIAATAAESEYESDPKIQKTFNEDAVIEHNKLVDEWMEAIKNPSFQESLDIKIKASEKGLTPLEMQKIDISADNPGLQLYILRRSPFYKDVMNQLVDAFKENIALTKRNVATQGTRSAQGLKDIRSRSNLEARP